MGVTDSFAQVWLWIVNSTFRLFNEFVIPGTYYTVLGLFVEILCIVLILRILKHWLGLEVGVFKSHYSDLRRQGRSMSETGTALKNRYRR